MNLQKKLLALSISLLSLTANANGLYKIDHIPGVVAHGVNVYNGEPITDYSEANTVPFITSAQPPLIEIGVFQEGQRDSGIITSETDRDALVATTSIFFDFFNPGGNLDLDKVNIPLGQVGNNVFGPGFTAVDQREVPDLFPELGTEPQISRKKGLISSPKVGDWEKISGKMTVVKPRKGEGSVVYVTIRDAFPNGIYTLWDVGARNPLSEEEEGYAVPLGGVPNVLTTNEKGCGTLKIVLAYDLLRSCADGAQSCTSFVNAFYHWDGQLYGAAPGATWAGAPTGVVGGNHLVWPTTGKQLIDPQTEFSPSTHGCY